MALDLLSQLTATMVSDQQSDSPITAIRKGVENSHPFLGFLIRRLQISNVLKVPKLTSSVSLHTGMEALTNFDTSR